MLKQKKQGDKMNKEIKDNGFMLIVLKPFFKRGLNFKVGDRLSPKMNYFEAIKEAKKYNCGHSVGGTKKVAVKPFINFKSSWQK
jgi:hypothetical protein